MDLAALMPPLMTPVGLLFVRLGAAVSVMPGIGDRFMPARARLALALLTAISLAPLALAQVPAPPESFTGLIRLVVQETMIGLFLGLTVRFLVIALSLAGQIIGQIVGLSNIFAVPGTGFDSGSILGAFLSIVAIAVFFVTDLHHRVLIGFADSFLWMPLGAAPDLGVLAERLAHTLQESMRIGATLSGPFLVLGVVYYVGLGLVNRMMVSLPVFFVSLPIGILAGLLILMSLTGAMLTTYAGTLRAALQAAGF